MMSTEELQLFVLLIIMLLICLFQHLSYEDLRLKYNKLCVEYDENEEYMILQKKQIMYYLKKIEKILEH